LSGLEQRIDAAAYRGGRIRARARGRAEQGFALWVFVQTQGALVRSAINWSKSASWTSIDVTADIRADADAVVVQLSSAPGSRAWFADISLELVEH
jgi:hypothetical protein